jgi:hypothetical protein
MPSPRHLALLLIAALAIAGCDIADDGPRREQTREVAGFTRIDNRDAVDVRLDVGEPQRITVRAARRSSMTSARRCATACCT